MTSERSAARPKTRTSEVLLGPMVVWPTTSAWTGGDMDNPWWLQEPENGRLSDYRSLQSSPSHCFWQHLFRMSLVSQVGRVLKEKQRQRSLDWRFQLLQEVEGHELQALQLVFSDWLAFGNLSSFKQSDRVVFCLLFVCVTGGISGWRRCPAGEQV